jgi:2'-5' RNA ligase
VSGAPTGGNWFLAFKANGSVNQIADLRHGAPAAIRWYHLDDYHVTLAFFGRVAPEAVSRIAGRVVMNPAQQIAGTVGKPLLLPTARRFSALAFSIESAELRKAITGRRDQWMELAGLPPESRDALPHLTFARPDRRASATQLRAIRSWMETLSPPQSLTLSFEGPMLFTRAPDGQGRAFRIEAPNNSHPERRPQAAVEGPRGIFDDATYQRL